MSDSSKKTPEPSSPEFSLLRLWDPWFRMGANVARSVAKATAAGKPVADPEVGGNALSDIVHYSWATVGNVVGIVTTGLGVEVRPAGASGQPGDTPAATPESTRPPAQLPTVHRGATLRVPLSVENPGTDGAYDLALSCARVVGEEGGEGVLIGVDAVRLEPTSLVVEPHDFEKLTVWIDTQAETATGRYEAVIRSADGVFEVPLQFEVV